MISLKTFTIEFCKSANNEITPLVIGCGNIYFPTTSCFYWALLHQLIIRRSALRKFCLANQKYISF